MNKDTVIATTDLNSVTYEDYLDWCADNGEIPLPEDSQYVKDWIADNVRDNYFADLLNIEHYVKYKVPVALSGTVGLWYGRREVATMRCESVISAIRACIGRDTLDVEIVWTVAGEITVKAKHHDGVNLFTINALNSRGKARSNWNFGPNDFKRLPYLYD